MARMKLAADFWLTAMTAAALAAGCAPLPATVPRAANAGARGAASSPDSFLYVANAGRGTVTVYRAGSKARERTVKSGQSFARSIAVDSSGRLYVPYWGGIAMFSGRNQTHADRIVNGTSAPYALALDDAQNLYVANNSGAPNGSVTVFSPGGGKLLRTITKGIVQPDALALDPAGNLYVANRPLDQEPATVTLYAKGARNPKRTMRGGIATPWTIAVDNNRTLYVLNGSNVAVFPAGSVSAGATITAGIDSAQALAIDRSGKLYVGNARSVTVYKPGSTTVYRTLREPAQTTALAFDGTGRLYVATSAPKSAVFVYAPEATKPMLEIGTKQGVSDPNALAIGPR